jgi:hypothetical protein
LSLLSRRDVVSERRSTVSGPPLSTSASKETVLFPSPLDAAPIGLSSTRPILPPSSLPLPLLATAAAVVVDVVVADVDATIADAIVADAIAIAVLQ